ncbi:MAG TPA: hypothetical protein VFJ90_03480, partial [Candidatus Didemnitutus sp.]|nr:hypothetical protein [Candidatus Didemnitutus sp.]
MKTFFVFLRRLVPASVVLGAASTFAAVEEQVVGTLSTATQTVVSDHGGHIALVARKGSRMVVAVDGVAGPKFDAIVTPSVNWIDPRPRQAAVATGPLDRHGHNQPAVMPVIFNADGSHFAYVGKVGQEWVVMQDQAEVARMPEAAGREVRLQFTESGKHLLFAVSSYDGFTLWVDGKAWPGFYATTGTGTSSSEPLISPDGEHIAYPAHYPQNSGKQPVLVVDGRELNYYAEKLMFTPDSKHLIAQAQTPKGIAVLIDGKSLFTARTVYSVTQAPAGLHIAAVLDHEYPDHSRGQFVVLDQKPVEATLCKNSVEDFTFSPDGQHWAVVCSNAPGHFYVVHDGKKESEYDMVTNPGAPGTGHGLIFSPDSSRLVYVAHGAGKYFVVINGEESDQAFDAAGRVQFSSDGKRLAYSGFESGQNNTTIVIDGK